MLPVQMLTTGAVMPMSYRSLGEWALGTELRRLERLTPLLLGFLGRARMPVDRVRHVGIFPRLHAQVLCPTCSIWSHAALAGIRKQKHMQASQKAAHDVQSLSLSHEARAQGQLLSNFTQGNTFLGSQWRCIHESGHYVRNAALKTKWLYALFI